MDTGFFYLFIGLLIYLPAGSPRYEAGRQVDLLFLFTYFYVNPVGAGIFPAP